MNNEVRLFRNRRTGLRFLGHKEPNEDVIYAELDINDNLINAGNRFRKEEFNSMLDDLDMEADYNTVGFTFDNGRLYADSDQNAYSLYKTLLRSYIFSQNGLSR